MKTIGVLTSGGDAPGMNAAVRAVTRFGIVNGLNVVGIKKGYVGLLEGDFQKMELSSVANVIQRGGTLIRTGRSKDFHDPEARKKAADHLNRKNIDGLIVIGGDGSFRGAHALWEEHKIPVIGVPGTIDNDIYGTDHTIGFDTACNTALDSIDRIRDTATSHDRTFFIEVMGRNSGEIALYVGVGGGAETIVLPDNKSPEKEIIENLEYSLKRGKKGSLVVVAEGGKAGRSYEIAKNVQDKTGEPTRVVILGHIQRGGSPTARDRAMASLMGIGAVRRIIAGQSDIMVGVNGQEIVEVPLHDATTREKEFNHFYFEMAKTLAK